MLLFTQYESVYGLALLAVTVSLHYLPGFLRSTVTCGKLHTIVV